MAGAFFKPSNVLAALVSVCSALALAADAAQSNAPRIDYLLHCGGCHGMAGGGSPPIVPALDDDVAILAGVSEGRDYLIRVPGSAQSRLDDAALARVLNWMLASFSGEVLPDDFTPFTAREVGRGRAITLEDPLRRRAEIWSKLTSQTEI